MLMTESEFRRVGKARDPRIPQLYGLKLFNGNNGDVITITGLTPRKCKNTLIGVTSSGMKVRFSVEFAQERIIDGDFVPEFESPWVRENLNPNGVRTGDCFIRAFAKSENISWRDAFKKIAEFACERGEMMDSTRLIVDFLKVSGYKKTKTPRKSILQSSLDNKKGIALTRNHAVFIGDNKYYDSFDSGSHVVNDFYSKV